jgi:hypothetical protein
MIDASIRGMSPADDRHRAPQVLAAPSELSENIPQLARYRFLHSLWPQMIDSWRDEGVIDIPAARRAIDSGASPDDVAQIARAVAYETVFAMLAHLAGQESAEDLPTWALTEVDAAGRPTGRHLDMLHEDLLLLDPSGQDGQDLWI